MNTQSIQSEAFRRLEKVIRESSDYSADLVRLRRCRSPNKTGSKALAQPMYMIGAGPGPYRAWTRARAAAH